MTKLKLLLSLMLALLTPGLSFAVIVGPYTTDANTLHLWHLDESTTPALDSAMGGTNLTSLAGNATLANAAFTGFGTCLSTFAQTNAVLTPTGVGNTNLVSYAGGNGAFTMEAVVHIEFDPSSNYVARAQPFNILNGDANSNPGRIFQFRIDPIGFQAYGGDLSSNTVRLEFINLRQAASGQVTNLIVAIPTTGPDAIVSNGWYHAAVTYTGTANTPGNLLFYWTLMDSSRSSADLIGGLNMPNSLSGPNLPTGFTVGNSGRNPSGSTANPLRANFLGKIDEVRISGIARAANQMLFAPANVVITQQPIGEEGVDYGSTGSVTVSATSAVAMRYQWWQNAVTPIGGATNATYTFTNASSANAGSYFCVITNVNGSAITSSVCSVLVGAANFLTNRYSFAVDATDSIGGQNGTNMGGVTYNGNGTLTLDGSTGYIQLPSNIINTNAGAVTIETWATFGSVPNNSMIFAFGNTNGAGSGYNYMFSTAHGATARMAITAGTYPSEQGAVAGSALDNLNNVQVVAVFAPYAGYEALYTNGVLAAINTNLTLPLSSVIDNFSFIGHSLFSSDPYLGCTLNEFRVYQGALSASSVKQSFLQGPDAILSDGPVQIVSSPTNIIVAQGQTVTFSAVTSGHQPILYQWTKNGQPIAGATNSTYSYAASFADNNATFELLATNTVGASVYSAASAAATLTVLVPETLAWFGASDNGWNLSSLNWSNSAQALVAYVDFDGAIFDNRGVGQPNVDLQFAATPISMTVSNDAADYDLYSGSQNGSLTVYGTLLKQGAGKFTLDVTNNSSGPTVVQNGTLQIGNGDTVGGLGSGPVTNNGTLAFNRTDGIGVANDLHGTGAVTINSGSVTPTSTNNDYTGSTVINGGILYATTSAALGATNGGTAVASGAQLYITANVNFGGEALSLAGVGGDGNGALRKGGAGTTTYSGLVTLTDNSTVGVDSGATITLNN
ncbi:MAG TPA: hypothetical protein VF988_07970, partial [Verrucomicrobiae bacterium]